MEIHIEEFFDDKFMQQLKKTERQRLKQSTHMASLPTGCSVSFVKKNTILLGIILSLNTTKWQASCVCMRPSLVLY